MNFISAILLIKFRISKISMHDIKIAITNIKAKHEIGNLENSIINPAFGYLFEAVGGLNNIRFFSPEIVVSKRSVLRVYTEDTSEDPLTSLVIELFPSPAGILCNIRTRNTNFGYKFSQDKTSGIKFLADAFCKIVKRDEWDNIQRNFDTTATILKMNRNNEFLSKKDNDCLKLMTIHAFIINTLDSIADLELYLKQIIQNIDSKMLQVFDEQLNVVEEVLRIQSKYRSFPYSEANQPPTNSTICVYDREKNKFIEDKVFSDCADNLIMNICNCIFFDPIMCCYSTEGLDQDSDLAKFYKNHTELFTVTAEIRKEWSKIVQGLEDFENKDKSKYQLHRIVYLKEKRNEVKSGIINMINILIKITGIDHVKFWSDFDEFHIEKKIIDLFTIIFAKTKRRKPTVNIDFSSFDSFISKHRTDFLGNFTLLFELINGNNITIQITQCVCHAEMRLVESNISQNSESVELADCLNSRVDLPLLVLKNFILMHRDKLVDFDPEEIFENLFFRGCIQTNDAKRQKLIDICNYIIRWQREDRINTTKIELLKRILSNILDTIDMRDSQTKSMFAPFLFENESLSEESIMDI